LDFNSFEHVQRQADHTVGKQPESDAAQGKWAECVDEAFDLFSEFVGTL
jgi:hypothetical protein